METGSEFVCLTSVKEVLTLCVCVSVSLRVPADVCVGSPPRPFHIGNICKMWNAISSDSSTGFAYSVQTVKKSFHSITAGIYYG